MAVWVEKSNSGTFLGVGVDETNNALYFTPDVNTTKYYATTEPFQFSSQKFGAGDAGEFILGVAQVPMTLVGIDAVCTTDASATATIIAWHAASGTNLAGGTQLVASAIDLEASGDDTVVAGTLHGTAANLDVAAGSLFGFVLTGAATSLADAVVTMSFVPTNTSVTFPNHPS